ncbi:hypothetical protein CUN85_06395 [Methanolobus halotolerans]|uniref:Uncharacterized protein n=1 Tax=Methanolobus halotolerans TaxID=2052935 RepID=A0A4E0PZQ5_9EURY|nr:hypothetical protein CUN85_06395 [Methanolobus halotolerans]
MKKALTKVKSLTCRRLLLYLTLFMLISFTSYVFYLSYLYIDYNFVQKEKIELYLDDTSKELVENSANDTELIENIVQWEREYYCSPTTNSFDTFDSLHEIPLRSTRLTLYGVYISKRLPVENLHVFLKIWQTGQD